MQDAIVQALFPQGRLIHVRQATAEGQLLVVPQGVGDQAHGQAFLGFRRVLGDRETQVLVDVAVQVGEVEIDFVGGRLEGHGGLLDDSRRAASLP
ncbi:hypothetical protein D3C78_1661930 [compost metagenome]